MEAKRTRPDMAGTSLTITSGPNVPVAGRINRGPRSSRSDGCPLARTSSALVAQPMGNSNRGGLSGRLAPRSGEYFDRPVNVDSCNDNVATRMIQVDEGLAAIQPGHAGIGRRRHGASGRAAILGKVAIEIQGGVVC